MRRKIVWGFGLLLACASVAASAVQAEPAYVFGPSPRALDNRAVFGAAQTAEWQALARAGVGLVVLNATFLMQSDYQRRGGAEAPPRPAGSFLDEADLAALADRLRQTGMSLIYEAGIGLSAEVCDDSLTAEVVGLRAARREFRLSLHRLTDAGISVAALNVDGAFLRLIEGSRKDWSCAAAAAAGTGDGFDPATTAQAALIYMKELRDLVAAANPDGRVPLVNLVVNLPNWQVQGLAPQGHRNGPALVPVFQAFAHAQSAAGAAPLVIAEIVVDYPYALIRADRDLFRDRSKHLWNVTRSLNPGAPPPGFGFILNSLSYANPCLDGEPAAEAPFLIYLRGGKPISAACQRAQIGVGRADGVNDSDSDYMRDSLIYAAELAPGGALAQALVTRDGSRIADHIGHFYMQSWGVNPLRNSWYMHQLGSHLRQN
ncbi:MAG: hypothetical protein Q7T28_13420 [Cypionkella sp.]|uniref:hypothetical protein n=1 Tax=Cypionkella sp. TaxID=2811411 RepID=UPI00272540F3|nr:hypothetical protein [Cypionkella sp.]MDO8327920.1 hypothetical protein [Cypionkella sp.]